MLETASRLAPNRGYDRFDFGIAMNGRCDRRHFERSSRCLERPPISTAHAALLYSWTTRIIQPIPNAQFSEQDFRLVRVGLNLLPQLVD
jgi:hypothetical protein